MMVLFSRVGGIEETASGRHWDGAMLGREVARRSAALAEKRIGRGVMVAIAHGGSADFFADLLALWRVGATAACLDPALTAPELETLVTFTNPAATLVSAKPVPCELSIPLLNLAGTCDLGAVPEPVAPDPNCPKTRNAISAARRRRDVFH
jgi:acyl-CoA synthetase (AMP-forming)/AMP-acid ligase II